MIAHHEPQQNEEDIDQSILPIKSKACRSYSSNNQNLDQIMKKANEIIHKSKNTSTCLAPENGVSQTNHQLGESFLTLTTADSIQKNGGLSTTREGNRISPLVTVASPEKSIQEHKIPPVQNQKDQQKQQEENQTVLCNGKRSLKSRQSESNVSNYQQKTTTSEADFFFENFDKLIRVVVINPVNGASKEGQQLQPWQPSESSQQQASIVVKSLVSTFDKVKKEEQSQQPHQQQSILSQIASHQRSATSSSIEYNNYLIPKSPQIQTNPYLLNPPIASSQPYSQIQPQTQNNHNESLDQYLMKPQLAKIKQSSTHSAHPPLPHNIGRGSIQQQSASNQVNPSLCRQRHSLKEKENNSEAANLSSFNNQNSSYFLANPTNQQLSSALLGSSNNSKSSAPSSSFLFATPTTGQNIIQQQGNLNHQRSTSYVIEAPLNATSQQQQINQIGLNRPRSDSNVGQQEQAQPESHLRINGTYAPLKSKALPTQSGDTPSSYRNQIPNSNILPISSSQRGSLQLSSIPLAKQSGVSKNTPQSNLLVSLMQGVSRQGTNSNQTGVYQLGNQNSLLSSLSSRSNSTQMPKYGLNSYLLQSKK